MYRFSREANGHPHEEVIDLVQRVMLHVCEEIGRAVDGC